MTILLTEGFDNIGAADGVTFGKWKDHVSGAGGLGNGNVSSSITTGRLGGSAYQIIGNVVNAPITLTNYFTLDTFTSSGTFFCSFGYKEGSETLANNTLLLYDANLALQLFVSIDATVTPGIYNSAGTLLSNSVTAIVVNQWAFLELGANISTTAGWAELRLNGVLTAAYYGAGGSSRGTANGNTRGGSSVLSSVRYARFGNTGIGNGNINKTFDDIVLYNSSGAVNNDFIGDVRVLGMLPTGNGTYSQFTRVGGTASGNWTAVNDDPINSDTSYVFSSINGTTDTYTYPTLPTSVSNVYAICSYPTLRRDDAGVRTATTHVITNTTEVDLPNPVAVTAGYLTAIQLMELNPVTGLAWQANDVNVAQFGPRVIS